jgi:hypothetical protein
MVTENKKTGYRKENTLNLFAGFLIGSLAGVLLMIVLARQPGMQTSDLIWQRGMNIRGRMLGTFQDLVKLTSYDNRQIPAGIRVRTGLRTPQPV